jgi:hypothetical protein
VPSAKLPLNYPISSQTHILIQNVVKRIIGNDFIVDIHYDTTQIPDSDQVPPEERLNGPVNRMARVVMDN